MTEFIYNHDNEVAQFIRQEALSPADFGRCKTIGVIDGEGRLLAGLVYFNYDPDAEIIEFTGEGFAHVVAHVILIGLALENPFIELLLKLPGQQRPVERLSGAAREWLDDALGICTKSPSTTRTKEISAPAAIHEKGKKT